MDIRKSILCVLMSTLTVCASNKLECNLDPALIEEIHAYQATVDAIIDFTINGDFKGETYKFLEDFTDTVGPRMVGSSGLINAVNWFVDKGNEENMDIVDLETFQYNNWTRGEESLKMTSPRQQDITVLGLGSTVSTPVDGLTADVVVVSDFDDLQSNADQISGKIVVYAPEWHSYGENVAYRARGAAEAAKLGAVASLIASASSYSLDNPHTGGQSYREGETEIPSAAISPEDAHMLYRLYKKGDQVTLHLHLGGQKSPDLIDLQNVIIGSHGYERPDEIVVVAGHLDSWDVGQGVMDDAGGVVISWQALQILKTLGLVPRRSIHAVFFSAEEAGIVGGLDYYNRHIADADKYQVLLESDIGTFDPVGIEFIGDNEATCIMNEILSLTAVLNATQLHEGGGAPDISPWSGQVPIGEIIGNNEKYFWYHHSRADTMGVYEPWMLDYCAALWTSLAFVSADISVQFPRPTVSKTNLN